jgi:hypothetical protein
MNFRRSPVSSSATFIAGSHSRIEKRRSAGCCGVNPTNSARVSGGATGFGS